MRLRGAVDRGLVALTCWLLRRWRARGAVPLAVLDAAGVLKVIDGDPYLGTAAGWTLLRGVADAPPPRRDAWRRSTFWSRDPDPPGRPAPWFREP